MPRSYWTVYLPVVAVVLFSGASVAGVRGWEPWSFLVIAVVSAVIGWAATELVEKHNAKEN